jgi:hypothetical protein
VRSKTNLVIAIKSGSTAVYEPATRRVEAVSFDTFYPGGLYGIAVFFIPADVNSPLQLALGQSIILYSGLVAVYEGVVSSIEMSVDVDLQGFNIQCVGYWGSLIMPRLIDKPWADVRLDEGTYEVFTSSSGLDKTTIDRYNRIRFVPKAVAWTSSEYAQLMYVCPTGQTIKRMTYNYNLQEGAQAWILGVYNRTTDSYEVSYTTSGSGSADITFGTPTFGINLVFQAGANQTPAADGSIFGEFSNIVVYTETGAINPTEIIKDIRGMITELSADESAIGSNTLSIVPFVANLKSAATVIFSILNYGDASNNAWAAGLLTSNLSSDGKPLLFYEQQPALTSYDYTIRLDSPNVVAPSSAIQRLNSVYNYIYVEYKDGFGRRKVRGPNDTATLKDTASIAQYGQRDYLLSVDTTSQSIATAAGVKFLAQYKGIDWSVVDFPITVTGYIITVGGASIPVSEICAGKRLRIENFMADLSGTGLTFLISRTRYSEDADGKQQCELTIGRPDSIDARIS